MNTIRFRYNLQTLLTNSWDVTNFTDPGVYIIYNGQFDLVYVGEAQNLLSRLGEHSSKLKNGTHACKKLQEDFTQLQGLGFRFLVVRYGHDMQSADRRRMVEGELLYAFRHQVYNISGANRIKHYLNQAVKINDVRFSTLLEAAESHNLSLEALQLRLSDPTNKSYVFDINNTQRGYNAYDHRPVVVWEEQTQAYRYFRTATTAAGYTMLSRQVIKRRAKKPAVMNIKWWDDLTPKEKSLVLDRPKDAPIRDKAVLIWNEQTHRFQFYLTIREAREATQRKEKQLAKQADDSDDQSVFWVLNASQAARRVGRALAFKQEQDDAYVFYPSIAAMHETTGFGRKPIKRWADDENNSNVVWV